MAVRQKPNGRWFVDIRYQHERHRIISPENSKRGAQAYEAFIRSQLAKGLPVKEIVAPAKEKTFGEFAEDWFATYVLNNNKPTTVRAKRTHLDKHLLPLLSETQLDEITATSIERLKSHKLKEGLSAKTVNNILSTLRICLNTAHEWEELAKVPKIKWLKVADQPFDFLNQEECVVLLQHAGSVVLRDMILCAMRTGMRRGELLGLEWSSVDFARSLITVKQSYVEGTMNSTKNNRIRHIPMTADLRSLLLARRRMTGYVFSAPGKGPVRCIRANKRLYAACKRANMRLIGWHVLRHTFASHLVMKGVPIRMVQALLGHSSIQMTERYAHLAPSSLQEAVAVLEQSKSVSWQEFGHYMGTNSLPSPTIQV